jgi:hypothetical protein
LTTMYSVMLPRNPPPEGFKQLLNLVTGANFALGWIRKWHQRLNYSFKSPSLLPGRAKLQVHIDATL